MNTLSKFLLIVSLAPGTLIAQEIPESFVPVKSNGMGGAYTAVSNDENSVWTNPAGIARVRKARTRSAIHVVKFPNMAVGGNASTLSLMTGVSDSSNEDSTEAISNNADNLESEPLWGSLSAFPLMMFDIGSMPSLAGGYVHVTTKAVTDSDDSTQARVEGVTDTGAVWGMAITNRTNRLNFGFNLRYVSRHAYEETLALTDLKDTKGMLTRMQDNSNISTAMALDLGFMWTFADFWFPTIGIAVFNAPISCKDDYLNPFSKSREKVCGTVFKGDIVNPDAVSTVDPTDIRFGLSITPRFGRKIAARISAGLHHMAATSGSTNYGLADIPFQKLVHAGIEVFTGNPLLPPPFSVSAGINQGFASFGASMRLSFLTLDLAMYGRDISTTDSPEEDQRYMAGLSVDF